MGKVPDQAEYVREILEALAESHYYVIPVEKILQRCRSLRGSEVEDVLNYLEDDGYLEIDEDFENVKILIKC